MEAQKLTDWFGEDTPPARPGVYEIDREDCHGRAFSHWDGERWGWATWERLRGGFQNAIDAAAESSGTEFKRRWRGIAEPPLTDWFDPDTPPVREGVYEIDDGGGFRHFAYWSKRRGWGCSFNSWQGVEAAIKNAVFSKGYGGGYASSRRWRGLAVQP